MRADPREVPVEPLLIEVSNEERAAIHSALGGKTTRAGTSEHDLFEALSEKGFVKEVMSPPDAIVWRLTRIGAEIAYQP